MEAVRDVWYTNGPEKHLRAHLQTHAARQNHQGVDLRSYTLCVTARSHFHESSVTGRDIRSTGSVRTNSFSSQSALSSDG